MLWLNLTFCCCGATLDSKGFIIAPLAPILDKTVKQPGWKGKHYRAVIAHFARKGQFIEARII